MAHGPANRPLTENGERVSVDETPERNALATADRPVAVVLEEILGELRKIRLAMEIQIGEEISDVDAGNR